MTLNNLIECCIYKKVCLEQEQDGNAWQYFSEKYWIKDISVKSLIFWESCTSLWLKLRKFPVKAGQNRGISELLKPFSCNTWTDLHRHQKWPVKQKDLISSPATMQILILLSLHCYGRLYCFSISYIRPNMYLILQLQPKQNKNKNTHWDIMKKGYHHSCQSSFLFLYPFLHLPEICLFSVATDVINLWGKIRIQKSCHYGRQAM